MFNIKLFKKRLKNKLDMKTIKSTLYIFKLWFRFFRFRAVIYVLATAVQPVIYVFQAMLAGILIERVVSIAQHGLNNFQGVTILDIPKDIIFLLFLQLVLGIIEFIAYYLKDLMHTKMNFYAETFHDTFIGEKFLDISAQQFEDYKITSKLVLVRDNMFKISEYPQYFVYGLIWSLGLVGVLVYVFNYNIIYGLIFSIFLYMRYKIYKNLGIGIYNIWGADAQLKQKYLEYNSLPYQTDIDSIAEMRVMGFHKWFLEKSKQFNNVFVKKFIKTEQIHLQKNLYNNIFYIIGTTFIYLNLISKVLINIKNISAFYIVTRLLDYVGWFSNSAFSGISFVLQNQRFVNAFYDFRNLKPVIKNGIKKLAINTIEFKNVWFKYPNKKQWVLRNINFTLHFGDKIAIVGENGAGKTTLIKLLLRIYDPTKGKILINGVDLRKINLQYYYEQIGLLSQNFIAPKITVKENIFIGNVNKPLNNDLLLEASKKANIYKHIQKLPLKFASWLNRELKDGVFFSGGQWQRLAIARVFYKDPRVIILDEPTSAIDAYTEKQVFDILFNLNKLVIINTHRLGNIRKADKVVVLKNGKIKEFGSFAILAENKSSELYKMLQAQNYEKI